MTIEEYMNGRVDDQIKWYDHKSKEAQSTYKRFQIAETLIAAAIPVLSAFAAENQIVATIIAVLGSAVVVIEAIVKMNKYHENWIEYRSTCELLRHEKYLYEMHSAPYGTGTETVEQLFVRNIEGIVSSESSKWKVSNAKIESDNGAAKND